MTRTRVRATALAAAVLASVLTAAVGARASGGPDPAEAGGGAHVVRPGDTLWAIARRLVGPEADPRPTVADIIELNGLGGSRLDPGMRLLLPVP